jgi:hypothetical protein
MMKKIGKVFLAVCLLASIVLLGISSSGIAPVQAKSRSWPSGAGRGGVKFNSPTKPARLLPPTVRQLCDLSPGISSGIYAADGAGGGAYVEDWSTGNLVWCKSGVAKVIATPPTGFSAGGYYGMGGALVCGGALCKPSLDLVLTSWMIGGLYLCIRATPTGCDVVSAGITLPASFCASMLYGFCNPDGTSLDPRSLNLYYADAVNGVVVECTLASVYQSCTVLENLYPYEPVNTFLTGNGNLWVSDASPTGNVWENGAFVFSVGDELEGITMSNANPRHALDVYVGDTGFSTGSAAHVIDANQMCMCFRSLPTPFTAPNEIEGLSTVFQLTSYPFGAVYVTQDLT